MVRQTEFAIVDVETTGLAALGRDRIVEIAVVRVDGRGQLLDQYVSLVNPLRDVGPTYIHGIHARDVKDAPLFSEIAGDVIARLSGAVFVAHNVHFDKRFVCAEMERAGCALPDFPFLCTMQLARRADPQVSCRKLDFLCRHFSIPLTQAHSALDDALATAQLFRAELNRLAVKNPELSWHTVGIKGSPLASAAWPNRPPCGKSRRRN